jgi:hypothetical protein
MAVADKTLSERLELAESILRRDGWALNADAVREAAALARRVEGAQVVSLHMSDWNALDIGDDPDPAKYTAGQLIALVPVEGGGGRG